MKNIIKRGTSLLLVLAMLLSFAAVVGAEGADNDNVGKDPDADGRRCCVQGTAAQHIFRSKGHRQWI
ncbi:MAG: hypothetical protein V8T01_03765 [Oscillospiraceae bacterium]